MIKYPSIILGGAPKCGTSSLFSWLLQHPSIQGSYPKEPFYIMDPDHPLTNSKLNMQYDHWSNYHSFYDNIENKLLLEGTTHIIYQKSVPSILSKLTDPPKIIFLLRNPIDRFFSSFVYSKNNLASIPSDLTFNEVAKKQLNGNFSPLCNNASGEIVGKDLLFGQYFNYLENWYDVYPQDKIRILLFEELINNPQNVLNDVFDFLELDFSKSMIKIDTKNTTKTIKNKLLHRRLRSLSPLIPNSLFVNQLKKAYFKLQNDKSERMDIQLRKELSNFYKPSNERLSKLLKRRLEW